MEKKDQELMRNIEEISDPESVSIGQSDVQLKKAKWAGKYCLH